MPLFQMKRLCEEFFKQLETKKLALNTMEDEDTTEADEDEVDVEEIFVSKSSLNKSVFLR